MIVFIVGYARMGVALTRLLRQDDSLNDLLHDEGTMLFAVIFWPFVVVFLLFGAVSIIFNYLTRP